jgi:transcriptional regulator with XRE-family HTH domain
MTSEGTVAPSFDDAPILSLGARLHSGMSLRELARQLNVSPSFVSQLENGKSQPSVATLYSLSRLLGISIDGLFDQGTPASTPAPVPVRVVVPPDNLRDGVRRSDLGSPADAWPSDGARHRFSIISPENRARLAMDSGVMWEQLAKVSDASIDFMEIIYPAGSSSTNDGRMLQHGGFEYGYLLQGELQLTYGFETFTLVAGQSVALDSWVPHLFTNIGTVDARGIWCVHHLPATTSGTDS